MKLLYLNNFRGFTETIIPFKKVNFFVGENSTGKSSILSLLKLMSSIQFWNNPEFNVADIELGFFNELVSSNLTGKKYFEIGFHIDHDEINNEFVRLFKTVSLTFENKGGNPRLTKMRVLIDKYIVIIFIGEKQHRIFTKEVEYQCSTSEDFRKFINDISTDNLKYSVINRNEDSNVVLSYYEIKNVLKEKLPKHIKINGIPRPSFLPFSTWIAPIRTKPKRIYESFKINYSPEGDHTPLLIKSALSNKNKDVISSEEFKNRIEKFGKLSGLFDKIQIESLGKDISSPFIVNVVLNGQSLKITNVG